MFRRWFSDIEISTIKCLEKCKMTIIRVVFLLTTIKAVDKHQIFLEKKQKQLRECEDHWELFGNLNFYRNYLTFDLLEQLIEVLNFQQKDFDSIASEMAKYKGELEHFRKSTTLLTFCQAEYSIYSEDEIPEDFKEVVVKFNWPKKVTLEKVEEFRKRYAHAYNLDKCAMMVYGIGIGSFTVSWLVPVCAIDKVMNTTAPLDLFKEFSVITVDIDGRCYYRTPVERKVSCIGSYHTTFVLSNYCVIR